MFFSIQHIVYQIYYRYYIDDKFIYRSLIGSTNVNGLFVVSFVSFIYLIIRYICIYIKSLNYSILVCFRALLGNNIF